MLPDYQSVSGVGLSNLPYGNLNIASQNYTSPAVATDWKITIPDTGELWRVIAIHSQLATDANAANRVVNYNIQDHDGNKVFEFGIGTAITASLTIPVTFSSLVASAVGDITTAKSFIVPIPDGPYLPGWTLNISTTAKQVGDQWSALRAWFIADQPLSDVPSQYVKTNGAHE